MFNGWSFGDASTRGGEENVYRNYSLRLLLEVLEGLRSLGSSEVEVIADLTHGQNYMPVALSREGAEASRLYAAAQGPEARVAVSMWMSDPFMEEGSELELHRVSAASIRGRDAADSLARDLDEALRNGALSPSSCDRFFSLDPSRARRVMEGLSAVVKSIDMKSICLYGAAAARAVIYSMPLAAVYIAGGVGERYGRRILEKVLRVARAVVDLSDGLTELRRGDGLVRVSPPLLLSERLRHLLYAAALLDYLSAAVPPKALEELKRFGGVSTDALRVAASRLSRLYEAVALSELDSLEKKCLGSGAVPSLWAGVRGPGLRAAAATWWLGTSRRMGGWRGTSWRAWLLREGYS